MESQLTIVGQLLRGLHIDLWSFFQGSVSHYHSMYLKRPKTEVMLGSLNKKNIKDLLEGEGLDTRILERRGLCKESIIKGGQN